MCIKYKIFSLRFKTESVMSVEKSTVQNNIHNT